MHRDETPPQQMQQHVVNRSTIGERRGCNKFVPGLRGNGTKVTHTGDIFDQPPCQIQRIRGKLADHVGDHLVLSPEGAVLVISPGTKSSYPRPPQWLNPSRIVTRGSCCTKCFAEVNGNCEIYCSLEQLVALPCAVHERKSVSGTYHPKTEGYTTRRYLYRPPGLLYCGGCTWARISGQSILAITWQFSQQTLLEP